jgi:hypothetical protein
MTFTAQKAQGEFIFVNSVNSGVYTVETPVVANETRFYAG